MSEIINVCFSDYDNTTIIVEFEEGIFEVQTICGEYKPSLDCWLNFTDRNGKFHENSNPEKYDNLANAAYKAAEDFIKEYEKENYEYKDAGFRCAINNCDIQMRINCETGETEIIIHDSQPGEYDKKYSVISVFDSEDEAQEFCDSFKTSEYHDFIGMNKLLEEVTCR